MGRTIAIGDIHGCAAALATLIEAIDPQPYDTIITLGDYIDRGPNSRGVIDQLIELQSRCQLISLLGNHELILQGVREGSAPLAFWLEACGGEATLASYEGRLDMIPAEHWAFVNNCRRYYQTQSHIFLHANYAPTMPVDQQPEELAFWMHLMRLPLPHISGKTVIVGHTPQRSGKILDAGHVICIDTFCCGDGCLTAFNVDTKECWQAEKEGVLLAWPMP